MSIIKDSGEHRTVEWFPKTASTALARNTTVGLTSGAIVNSANANNIVGVILRDVTASSDDYALTTKVPIELWTPDDIFLSDVITGTLTTAMVGTKVDIASTYDGIDVTATSNKNALIVGFVSTTKALIKIIGSNWNNQV